MAATPASAVAVALTPSAPSRIHSVRKNTDTTRRAHSSRDLGSRSGRRANSGDSGVRVIPAERGGRRPPPIVHHQHLLAHLSTRWRALRVQMDGSAAITSVGRRRMSPLLSGQGDLTAPVQLPPILLLPIPPRTSQPWYFTIIGSMTGPGRRCGTRSAGKAQIVKSRPFGAGSENRATGLP